VADWVVGSEAAGNPQNLPAVQARGTSDADDADTMDDEETGVYMLAGAGGEW